MNIVLIGYRGTGKSTVALALARILKREVISLDETIVRTSGLSIPEIVER
ncbi:MAG: AAA family ATPase, partial [Proteobacteria bacterium]|nr:AAA family ATPase [Pseudomonadota bacterium]